MVGNNQEQRLEELEKRVKVYEDIEEIKQLQTTYTDSHVFGDAESEVACFAEDGIYELVLPNGISMKTPKSEMLKRALEMGKIEMVNTEVGIVVHPKIKVDGDKATGRWTGYNMIASNESKQPLELYQGVFDCEYIRENGEWKIKHLKITLKFGSPPPGGSPK